MRRAVFSVGPCRGVINGASLEFSSIQRVVEYSTDCNEVRAEVEEFPLLEAVTWERLVKTQQTEKV
jgi:hypothetical protein